MADKKKCSHRCCAAALCNNRTDNRQDLTFHAFPKDTIRRKEWAWKMKRDDEQFAWNSSLFCCEEHFKPDDYRKSLTGLRNDLKSTAVPSVFPWTIDKQCTDSDRSQRLERRNIDKVKNSTELISSNTNVNETEDISCSSKQEIPNSETPTIDELCARVKQLEMQLELPKFGLARFCGSDDDIYFYTGFPKYEILMAFLE
ncbi:uncharacterized protein LOC110237203, partial [Exaiptasia diaphana]|uniref:THAP-type domain-containing protein n=1 Tax=Exaiptasia diaphana TaxID=2652724 RepID=A0A913X3N7_EXADI